MTEQEWLASTDPVVMLDFLMGPRQHAGNHRIGPAKPSDRKLRLWVVACRLLETFKDPDFQGYPPGGSDLEGNRGSLNLALATWRNFPETPTVPTFAKRTHILRDIINPFRPVTLPVGEKVSCSRCGDQRDWHDALTGDGRCFDCQGQGGFYGPSPVLTPLVRSLAEAAYQERQENGELDPDRLAVLSDALIDAGMPEGDLLAHLREPGPHYPGCWAVDLLTGRG